MEKIEFTPKQWVLVRDNEDGRWALAQFSNMWNDSYVVVGGIVWNHCIPYEGNEHLLGTTDDYVEPYKPKDGDFIAIKVYEKEIAGTNHWICIFKSISDSICAYAGLAIDGHLVNKGNGANYNKDWMEYARPATEEEKQLLLDAIHKEGKDWDAEKMEVVDYKWSPERLEEYHYCKFNDELNEFEVETTKNYELPSDVNRVKSGNCYKEWVDCSDRCDKMNKLLKGE